MATFGSTTKSNLPTSFSFSYDGTVTNWDNRLYKIADIFNQADPVDNKLRISDMRVSFIDTDNTIWGSLGNGTSAFQKSISGTVFIGGSMGPVSDDLGVRYKKVSNTGAYTNAFHTGKIDKVSKKGNVVSIQSKNIMNLLPLVEWQFPVNAVDEFEQGSYHDKYSFCLDNPVTEATWGSLVSHAGFNRENGDSKADFYGYAVQDGVDLGNYATNVSGIYDTSAGTGIEDTLVAPDTFLNDDFHLNYKPLKFKGTFFGTLHGTIDSGTQAQGYGYGNLAEAEADRTGTIYPIEKMRFEWASGTADPSLTDIYYRALMRMEGDPTAILRHLLFGKMVTSYYDETAHMGTDTFYEAARVGAYKFYEQTIDPNDTLVLPYITDLLNTESALFYVSSKNQFNFEPYGPKNLSVELSSIGASEIVEAGYSNDLNDSYNRVVINYNYSFETKEFNSSSYGTLDDWGIADDRPLEIDSHWLISGNQAAVTVARQLSRYRKTFPKVTFSTNLKYSGLEVGSLVKITDSDAGVSEKIVQISGYQKKFGNSNQLSFYGYDGESLFRKRGYALWEDGTTLDEPVSGSSTSGWGTNGTVTNINEELYGTQFVWW